MIDISSYSPQTFLFFDKYQVKANQAKNYPIQTTQIGCLKMGRNLKHHKYLDCLLISNVSDDAIVTYNNINFTVHLTNDVQEFGAVGSNKDGDVLYQFEFDVEESL